VVGLQALTVVGVSAQSAQPGAQSDQPAVVPGPTAVAPSLAGLWVTYVGGRPDGLCQETYRFFPDGHSEESSGAARTESRYEWAADVGADGFRPFTVRVLKHNGQRDCAGNLLPVGTDLKMMARIHPTGYWLEVCSPQADHRMCSVLWRLMENAPPAPGTKPQAATQP